MATILYLSNQLVQAVEARRNGKKIIVQAVCEENAPEGSIINGIITDEEAFLPWIKRFFIKNKLPRREISLVVGSTQFNNRVLELPRARETEIMKMLPREFSDSRTEDTLFTYQVLEEIPASRKQRLLAASVEQDFLLSYVSFFKQAGIELVSIDTDISCMVRLFMGSQEIRKKNCIVQVLNGMEIISMLFVEGCYYYSQRNRLLLESGSEKQAEEIEAIVNRLLQFATAEQIKEPVKTLYLCGKGQERLKKSMEEVFLPMQQVVPLIFKGDKSIVKSRAAEKKKPEFIYPAGCVLHANGRLNFYKQMKQDSRESKKKKEHLKLALPACLVLIICLVISAALGGSYLRQTGELDRLQKAAQDSGLVNDHAGYELSSAGIAAMEEKISIVETAWEHLMSYPSISSSVDKLLNECAGGRVTVELKSFDRDSGVLTMEAFAKQAGDINGFIENLQKEESFEAVEYSGYTYAGGADVYSIHVVCCMAEGAGRPEE